MKNKLEILSPAGGIEALNAAINSGADAIYVGAKNFSARDSAANFSKEELIQARKITKISGVKLYVAVNTVVKDTEINILLELLEFLCQLDVDSVIVQDLGIFYLAKKLCPQLKIHASTQMSVMNTYGAEFVKNIGAKRVVLARELSLKEISDIKTDIELEVFVHGALCMCVSGQCYFSAMLGSRSGNRGKCAQPCRLPFKVTGGTGHDLSLKDLSIIEDLPKLEKSGVTSAKIEGRMKRAEYVAAAVTAARQSVDHKEVEPFVKDSLEAVFSRSGFTKGYFEHKLGKEMFGIRTKEDVQNGNSALFGKLHNLYKTPYAKVALNGFITAFVGEKICLELNDKDGNTVKVYSDTPFEKAINKAMDEENLKNRLSKTGGTPYYLDDFAVYTDNQGMASASVINNLRRDALEKLSEIRAKIKPISFNYQEINLNEQKTQSLKLRAEFKSVDQIPTDISMLNWVYLPLNAPLEDFLSVKNTKVGVSMPRALFENEDKVIDKMNLLIKNNINTFMCYNVYALEMAKSLNANIHGGYSLNITNSFALASLEEYGVKNAELSFELTQNEIKEVKGNLPKGIMIYGRQALMLTRNCPISNGKSCNDCKMTSVLTDRKSTNFPVLCSKYKNKDKITASFSNYAEVFNSVPMTLSDKMSAINGVDFGILRFTVENRDETSKVLSDFVRHNNSLTDFTRGLFHRGIL
ncbi:MAG: U32 family peptidase [Clostridia bacterium]